MAPSIEIEFSGNTEISRKSNVRVYVRVAYLRVSMHLERPLSRSGDREILKGERGGSREEISIDVPRTPPEDSSTIFCISEDIEI